MSEDENKESSQTAPIRNVSNFRLRVSYWYISHKLQLRQGLVISLILSSLIFYGFSTYRAVMLFLIESQSYQRDIASLTANYIDYAYFRQANKPLDLQILSFDATDGREGRFDFIAKIANPNPDFVASEVTVQLVAGSKVVAEKTGFIYPTEEKFIIIFGQEVSQGSNPILRIDQVKWRRYRNFEFFAQPRLKFNVSDIKFQPAGRSRGSLPVSTLNFKITNDSAFSYWQVGVNMVLSTGQGVAAANFLALDQFLSGETRTVEMRWHERLSGISKFEILPEVDILDPASFMPVQ